MVRGLIAAAVLLLAMGQAASAQTLTDLDVEADVNRAYDPNRDGRVTLEEYLRYPLDEPVELLKQWFNEYDANDNGVLDGAEIEFLVWDTIDDGVIPDCDWNDDGIFTGGEVTCTRKWTTPSD